MRSSEYARWLSCCRGPGNPYFRASIARPITRPSSSVGAAARRYARVLPHGCFHDWPLSIFRVWSAAGSRAPMAMTLRTSPSRLGPLGGAAFLPPVQRQCLVSRHPTHGQRPRVIRSEVASCRARAKRRRRDPTEASRQYRRRGSSDAMRPSFSGGSGQSPQRGFKRCSESRPSGWRDMVNSARACSPHESLGSRKPG